MPERFLLLAFALTATTIACGRDLGPPPSADDAGSPPADSGTAVEPLEQKISEIPCGPSSCSAGQACCLSASGASCSLVGEPCPAAPDAGVTVAPPSPLKCTTYNNCDGGDDCCFTPDAGSECASSCKSGQSNLCQRGKDGCGSDYDCRAFSASPAPDTIGRCVESDE